MKTIHSLLMAIALTFSTAALIPVSVSAQTDGTTTTTGTHGRGFVDLNGDGYHDNAPDADGDGIPNGKDPDWTRPQDGSGAQNGVHNKGIGNQGKGKGAQNGKGIQKRLCDGICNLSGTGTCDGTGPKGAAQDKGKN